MKWLRKVRFPRQNKDLFHNGYGRDFALQRIPASIATRYWSVEAATIVLLREKNRHSPYMRHLFMFRPKGELFYEWDRKNQRTLLSDMLDPHSGDTMRSIPQSLPQR